MLQVSSLSWMAPLDAQRLNLPGGLPQQFTVRVRAANARGDKWEAAQRVTRTGGAAPVATTEDWPEFMGTAQRSGRSRTPLAPPLQMAWCTPSHGTIDFSSPVLYKQRLAIGVKDRDNLLNNGVLVIDPKTGKPVKFVKTDSMVNGSPAFAEDTEDGPGKLIATSMGGTMYTIAPEDGELESMARAPASQPRWLYSSPAVQGKLAVIGNAAYLQAMDPRFGELKWTNNFGTDWISSNASPSLAGEVVLMAGNWQEKNGRPASIYALDVNHGQVKWVNVCEGTHNSVSISPGRGYAVDTHGVLKDIDLENGVDLTTRTVGKGWSLSTPAVDEEVVIAAGASGEVHAFETATMRERWVFRSGKGMWNMAPYDKSHMAVFSSPTIAGNTVYIGCSDGRLYALDKSSGQVTWSYDFGVPTLSTPCVSGNSLFTAAYDGNVYAFTARASQ
jgi:outer membrane protein assembly factor BamB